VTEFCTWGGVTRHMENIECTQYSRVSKVRGNYSNH
jgi:hypothetical protein